MSKQRNKKYNPQKLQTMRNQGKASRNVPLTALTPAQVALKIRAKQIIKQNSFPEVRDQREGCEFAGWMEISMASRPAEWRVNRMRFYGGAVKRISTRYCLISSKIPKSACIKLICVCLASRTRNTKSIRLSLKTQRTWMS